MAKHRSSREIAVSGAWQLLLCVVSERGYDRMSQRKKWKIQRALGLELPGLGKPGALEKRNYPPGQHGKARKPKLSQFGAQLQIGRASCRERV